MVKKLPDDLTLTPLPHDGKGQPRSLEDWLTTFHLASVVLDPFTNESSWILKTAVRVLDELRGSHARVNFVVTAEAVDTRRFMGPLTERFLIFTDPERHFVTAAELTTLPAFVFVRVDGEAIAVAEGWDPHHWAAVAESICATTKWRPPTIPAPGDPHPFAGTPALG